ncbi:UPF0336 protein [Rhodococcoides trifolii]|uniref:UPF0336 protein GCM10007304_07860 n=2 Tax=Rhodococcoides trifolii TaxID=908250 RepID=A0A917CSJ8_9NOCA|nr:UPF0336 protein [Rhodococcus trifolii]
MTSASTVDETESPAEHALRMVGHHYRMPDFYEVGREKIREYARSVQDGHAVHYDEQAAKDLGYDGLIAPLTFVSIVGVMAQKAMFDTVIKGYDVSQIMQADQRLEFHHPIRTGDHLMVDVYLESFRQMGGSDIFITKNIISNASGEAVVSSWTTLVARTGGASDVSYMDTVKGVMMHEL